MNFDIQRIYIFKKVFVVLIPNLLQTLLDFELCKYYESSAIKKRQMSDFSGTRLGKKNRLCMTNVMFCSKTRLNFHFVFKQHMTILFKKEPKTFKRMIVGH